ncbi:surface carbohydrate biosynthesis protein [Cecembia calidifontis]|uniref:Surface carbohydrate biosynthesis protein n=1 Tax=Cecembia calidifontis TaxID=1187080 RepID=A0A4Q7PD24_9BACT|nr:surface carbohydrate biosynthesis protein [Cecembia calidifontis]RZS98261.1 surface carbohydrate biosynthesis protein [Cecembia calidifontis]
MNYLLPIETINREIDFKLVLAAKLASQRKKLWIGQYDFLSLITERLFGGIYIGKNIFLKRSDLENGEHYKSLKARGFEVVYLHEEGAVFSGIESDWKNTLKSQYDLRFFNEKDKVCVWGEFQNEFDKNRSENVKIITTGHPRFDLYTKQYSWIYNPISLKLQEKYGDFILINGNYGVANHGIGLSHIFSKIGNYLVDDIQSRLKRIDFFSNSTNQMVAMIQLTHHLAVKFPEVNFVFRPHPSENHETYKIIFKGVNNIIVNHEGAVGPWILGAKAVIHDGCTTAIEAALSGVPVINYKPHYDPNLDIWLPNQMGVQLKNHTEVFDYLRDVLSGKEAGCKINNIEKVSSLFENFKSNAFENLIQVIKEVEKEKGQCKVKEMSNAQIKALYLKFELKRKLYALKNASSRNKLSYHNRKFYGFSKVDLEPKFKLIQEHINPEVRFKIHNPFLIEVQ